MSRPAGDTHHATDSSHLLRLGPGKKAGFPQDRRIFSRGRQRRWSERPFTLLGTNEVVLWQVSPLMSSTGVDSDIASPYLDFRYCEARISAGRA